MDETRRNALKMFTGVGLGVAVLSNDSREAAAAQIREPNDEDYMAYGPLYAAAGTGGKSKFQLATLMGFTNVMFRFDQPHAQAYAYQERQLERPKDKDKNGNLVYVQWLAATASIGSWQLMFSGNPKEEHYDRHVQQQRVELRFRRDGKEVYLICEAYFRDGGGEDPWRGKVHALVHWYDEMRPPLHERLLEARGIEPEDER
jgi:hypothetical protein